MKILMVTRKVDKNDHLAGFIYNWVRKIGEKVEELKVISWQEGDSTGLPGNIKITHLKTRQNKILKIFKFIKLIRQNIFQVDGIFCHQMPIYTILAAPIARLHGKKVVSWYMHRKVDWRVKLMERLADVILSASKESFRLPSKKLVITGHGIDIEQFKPAEQVKESGIFRLLTVGRISPTKDYESMIKAVDILSKQGIKNIKLTIIGEAGLAEQKIYFESLKQMTEKMGLKDKVEFLGPKPNREISAYLCQSDLFVNMSGTGSIDKAVLEAMSCGCLVLTANEAFFEILPAEMQTHRDNPGVLAEKIKAIIDLPSENSERLKVKLRQEIVNNHNLDNLVKKIISQFSR